MITPICCSRARAARWSSGYFDPPAALRSAARLAAAVIDAPDLEAANEILHGMGVYTELDYERDALHTVRQPSK